MRLHRRTSAAQVRGWPPAVQVGHIASELMRAGNLAGQGATLEARNALLRARELLGVLETCPSLPESWGPELARAVTVLRTTPLDQPDPAVWRSLYDSLMELCSPALQDAVVPLTSRVAKSLR